MSKLRPYAYWKEAAPHFGRRLVLFRKREPAAPELSTRSDIVLVLRVDPNLSWISLVPVVKFTEAHRYFLAALQGNPGTPRPPLRMGTVADFHE